MLREPIMTTTTTRRGMNLLVEKVYCRYCGETHPAIIKNKRTTQRYYCSNCYRLIKEVCNENEREDFRIDNKRNSRKTV